MLSGNTRYHEKLEKMFAEFEKKEDAYLYNFGYQGIVSTIDALTARHDVIVYDAECHACLLDGIRLHIGSIVTTILKIARRFLHVHALRLMPTAAVFSSLPRVFTV